MVVHKKTGSTSETFVRSDQDGIDVKIDFNGKVSIRFSGKAIYGRFWRQGEKGGEPITGAESRVGLNSPHILTPEGFRSG